MLVVSPEFGFLNAYYVEIVILKQKYIKSSAFQ